MTDSDARQTLLAINSTEWLNLCARASIRMSKRRPITVSVPASEREMEKVFASAPFTKISSSVDLFVLVIDEEWAKSKRGHRSNPSEILQLNLSDVKEHHPVAREHFEYYNSIGSKCGVYLADPIFEQAWVYWITNETIKASWEAAERLQRALHIQPSSEFKRADKYKWEDIARLVLRPNETIKAKPAHLETLLSNLRRIADAVSSTRDTEQFYLACAIEWTDIRLNKDPMKKKATRDLLVAALANAKELPLGVPTEQTSTALTMLAETFPKAFTDELTPMTVAHVVQLLTESRTKKLKPETVSRIFYSLDSNSSSATVVAFVLATSLGIELTNQLILATTQVNQVPMNWDLPI
jgi:hypothetical protein